MSSEHPINDTTTKETTDPVNAPNDEQRSCHNEVSPSITTSGLGSLDSKQGATLSRSSPSTPLPSTSAVASGTKSSTEMSLAPISVPPHLSQTTISFPSHPSLNNSLILPSNVPNLSILQPQQPLVVDPALLRHRRLASTLNAPQQPYAHLRSGKWLPAEENYALLLVAMFERGMITDCVDGTTTLRTYLSQKLHCAPMRISKKFAGRGIGKLIYTSKLSPQEQHKMPELLERLRIAERQFLQAAYPTPIAAALGVVPFPLLQVPPTATQPVSVFPSAILPGIVPNPKTMSSIQPNLTPMESGSNSAMPVNTSELHKSYLRALKQAEDEALSSSNTEVSNVRNHDATNGPQTVVSLSVQIPPPITKAPSTDIPDLLSGFEQVVKGMKDTPDSQSQTASNPSVNASNEYSPPFTSRSFDEFHRFLGKDEISLLDTISTTAATVENSKSLSTTNAHVTANTMNPEVILPKPDVELDTAALFAAESYSMMAQASASEVSQHGAYSMSLPSHFTNEAVNVESILQQVQAHRDYHAPPNKSESMSTNSSYFGNSMINPPANVTIPNHATNISLSSNPSNTSTRKHHVTASSQSEDVNIVSGSEPSGGSSSSRSNTSNTSSNTDTTSNDDDGSDDEEGGLTSSGGEFDSAEDDDNINNNNINTNNYDVDQQQDEQSYPPTAVPPRKRVKYNNNNNKQSKQQQRGEQQQGKTKRVQFQ